jgi:TRAP-type transport system periplasmic protein
VLKYANETRHIMLINFQVFSSQWFDALPAEHQTVLVEECKTAGRETSEKIAAAANAIKADLQTKGMEIVTDVDIEAFRKAGEKAYEALGIADAKKALDAEMGR